jgi:hypothetical protein
VANIIINNNPFVYLQVNKLPFLSTWIQHIKKLEKGQGKGWDFIMSSSSKNNKQGEKGKRLLDHQGADLYVLKCQEIGETPCSRVSVQLKCPAANMAHCKLGRCGSSEYVGLQ